MFLSESSTEFRDILKQIATTNSSVKEYSTEYKDMNKLSTIIIPTCDKPVGYDIVLNSDEEVPTFQKNILSPSLYLKTKTVCTDAKLISAYRTTTPYGNK
jgi:hypothetical protein